ncbi:hypothetical protein NE237_021400 [Protea cynaroides]|uniref:Uncharacterized protein n=1 Tax=Protea cynaroides TaxID=273540 RepID=A0A9Q0K4B6_9MAGN|nr:hypothetical protein NE237_021400 [Protea cynaroides]
MMLAIREHPPPSYSSAQLPHHPHEYRGYIASLLAPPPPQFSYSGYHLGYYSQPPPSSCPLLSRVGVFGYGGSSEPSASSYDHKLKGSKGVGTSFAVGAAAGAFGGLALEEGLCWGWKIPPNKKLTHGPSGAIRRLDLS